MKKATILFSLLAVSTLCITGCGNTAENDATETENASVAIDKGSIVYFDLDRVLQEYDMANDKRSEVETKAEAIQKEINRRQKNLENAIGDFNNKINKGLMTSAVATEQQKKLQQQEASFQQYAQEKQNEMMEEQQVMMNQLADAIKTYVDEYNEEKQYAIILSNTAGVPVITADSALDITDEIIKGLNEKYVKEKNK